MKRVRRNNRDDVPVSLALPIGLYGLAVCGTVAYLAFGKPAAPAIRVFLPEQPKAENVIRAQACVSAPQDVAEEENRKRAGNPTTASAAARIVPVRCT